MIVTYVSHIAAVCSKETDVNGIEWPSVNVTEDTNVTTNCIGGTVVIV